jgi:hypothetical protein
MLPIAYDNQVASRNPEKPEVGKLLLMSLFLGVIEAMLTLFFSYGAQYTTIFKRDYTLKVRGDGPTCGTQTQSLIWLQMFIAAEILIFSARAQSYMWVSVKPSIPLIVSVIGGCAIFCILAGQSSQFANLPVTDILLIWAFNLVTLFGIDIAKVQMLRYFRESEEVLPNVTPEEEAERSTTLDIESNEVSPPPVQILKTLNNEGRVIHTLLDEEASNKREHAEVARLANNIALKRSHSGGSLGVEKKNPMNPISNDSELIQSPASAMLVQRLNTVVVVPRSRSGSAIVTPGGQSNDNLVSSAIMQSVTHTAPANNMRKGLLTSGYLHPNTPGSLAILRRKRTSKD